MSVLAMDAKEEDPEDEGHWTEVKTNILTLHGPQVTSDYDLLRAKLKFKAASLNKMMKAISGLTTKVHLNAFISAFQANLLQDHCDRPLHLILKDVLVFLASANFCKESSAEDMEDGGISGLSEGEIITTDTGNDSEVSSAAGKTGNKAKSKALVLSLPHLSKLSEADLLDLKLPEAEIKMVDLAELSHFDYFVDNQFLWIDESKRVGLSQRVQIPDRPDLEYDVVTCLKFLEAKDQGFEAYCKEMLKLNPDVEVVQEAHFKPLASLLEQGLIKVPMEEISKEKLLQIHLQTCHAMIQNK